MRTHLGLVVARWCSSAIFKPSSWHLTPAPPLQQLWQQQSRTVVSSSAELVAKWECLLQRGTTTSSSSSSHDSERLRQLCQDAIAVCNSEGAASVVPDAVTECFMAAYAQLQGQEQQLAFFRMLVTQFGVQRQALDEAVQLYLQRTNAPASSSSSSSTAAAASASAPPDLPAPAPSTALLYRLAERLSAAAKPLYMQLLLPVSQHRSGIKFLVDMRADLLSLLQQLPAAQLGQQGVALRALDQDLRAALARWFSLGLLQLHRITFEHSSGQLLQRVQQTEAVHKMRHLEELQRRLQQSDRRVFAFLHPSLPGEPLVVLHTAIVDSTPSSMDAVLAAQQQGAAGRGSDGGTRAASSSSSSSDSAPASVACFYSISSSQRGLAGVDLGNFLIKKAAQLLLSEMPQLKTLVTLSPIPGFRSWLMARLRLEGSAADADGAAAAADKGQSPLLLRDSDVAALLQLQQQGSVSAAQPAAQHGGSSSSRAAAAEVLLQLVQDNSWCDVLPLPQQEQMLRGLLLRLCAVYLLCNTRRNFALDPVAHFHSRNGAQMWRLNWRADMSAQGLANSCGLMVNYLYDMPAVVANNQRYMLEHRISASPAVRQLLQEEEEEEHP